MEQTREKKIFIGGHQPSVLKPVTIEVVLNGHALQVAQNGESSHSRIERLINFSPAFAFFQQGREQIGEFGEHIAKFFCQVGISLDHFDGEHRKVQAWRVIGLDEGGIIVEQQVELFPAGSFFFLSRDERGEQPIAYPLHYGKEKVLLVVKMPENGPFA